MLVVFSSVTTAERIKTMLLKQDIKSKIVQTPKSIAQGGCGYSLTIQKRDIDSVKRHAAVLGARIKAIFDEVESGGTKKYIQVNLDTEGAEG